ncbi:hypothetical protein FQZ97_827490 [compost metagenome]
MHSILPLALLISLTITLIHHIHSQKVTMSPCLISHLVRWKTGASLRTAKLPFLPIQLPLALQVNIISPRLLLMNSLINGLVIWSLCSGGITFGLMKVLQPLWSILPSMHSIPNGMPGLTLPLWKVLQLFGETVSTAFKRCRWK